MKNALIIDGHNYLFKGFYGVPEQAKRSDGTQINAVYGFFSLLRKLLGHLDKLDYIVVAFDAESSIDKKVDDRPEYKANRTEVNTDVYSQLPLIKACLDILDIDWRDDENHEADDLIGSFCSSFLDSGVKVNIGSNDWDFMQLVRRNVYVLRSYHGEISVFDEDAVVSHLNVHPRKYLDFLALKGDVSDNISGIKGIGKKRASDLILNYGDIKGIYESFEDLSPMIQRLLKEKREFLLDQKEFFRIKEDIQDCDTRSLNEFSGYCQTVPDKMGGFLDTNWDEIKSIALRYS